MDALLTYILHVNLLISLIYLGYYFLLKKLTFYNLNRFYFLFGGVYAFVFPLIDFNIFFKSKIEISSVLTTSILPFDLMEKSTGFNLQNLVLTVICIGGLFFILKMIMQFFSLARIHRNSTADYWNQYQFRNVIFSIAPFTFFRTIYLHKNQHQNLELNDIFKHEFIHVNGLHSIDVLVFEIIQFFCWYNPLVWLLRRAVSQNLEFLTDQKVLDLGIDRKAYQFSLLHVTSEGSSMPVGNQFNFKSLKIRIIMMNKNRSSKINLSAYAFLMPVLIFTGISFTSFQAEAKIDRVVASLNETELSSFNHPIIGLKTPASQFLANLMINKAEVKDSYKRNGQVVQHAEVNRVGRSTDEITHGPVEDREKSHAIQVKKSPLVIVDGVIMSTMEKIDPNMIQAMEILKGSSAVDQYGEAGREGVILITLKENAAKKSLQLKAQQSPIYVLDGEVVLASEANQVSPDSIANITVLKGDMATAVYGEDGRHGVVQITSLNSNK